jgi:alpha-1,3/alpha-1,6-mannosyltransferase
LVVDAAVGLLSKGHKVTMFTSYHDQNRAFKETTDGSFPVIVRGDGIPREYNGKGHVLFAIIKAWYLALSILFKSWMGDKFDVLIVDQISASIPILRLTGSKILFYCHFPDKLLTKRTTFLKTIYRLPFDILEEVTTKMADVIVVNSEFTQGVFKKSFKWIPTIPQILYPGIRLESYDAKPAKDVMLNLPKNRKFLLSINRFERKKQIELAVQALEFLKVRPDFSELLLILAGDYT